MSDIDRLTPEAVAREFERAVDGAVVRVHRLYCRSQQAAGLPLPLAPETEDIAEIVRDAINVALDAWARL